ncbi:MAG TPA: GNAT family protein [Burkholderiaceae bacterium]|nr:GNAT family protein [Burkholderiaceae bacterium]
MFDVLDSVAAGSGSRSAERAARIVIRPIQPGDETDLGAFFRELSPASRHRRFLAVVNELPPPVLARFARPEQPGEIALVATARDGETESLIAEARVAPDTRECRCAEFALAVIDPEQGRGLGERLLRSLLRRARETGLARIYGDVLPDNRPMLGLARKLGFSERRSPADPRLVRVERAVSEV